KRLLPGVEALQEYRPGGYSHLSLHQLSRLSLLTSLRVALWVGELHHQSNQDWHWARWNRRPMRATRTSILSTPATSTHSISLAVTPTRRSGGRSQNRSAAFATVTTTRWLKPSMVDTRRRQSEN